MTIVRRKGYENCISIHKIPARERNIVQLNLLTLVENQKHMYQNISNQEFSRLTKEGKVIVVDVRTPKEVNEGFIPAAKHFIDINNQPFEELIQEYDKSKDYVIYCRSGARSAKACRIMEEKGFKGKLYNLGMGITGWDGDVKTK